jgi:hypothetical protein
MTESLMRNTKQCWILTDFKAPNLPLSLRLKVSGCHYNRKNSRIFDIEYKTQYKSDQVRVITVFTVFRLLTDFVCLYTYEFLLSLCKIVRSSVILLLPLFIIFYWTHASKIPNLSHKRENLKNDIIFT